MSHSLRHAFLRLLCLLAACVAPISHVHAQSCEPDWLPGDGGGELQGNTFAFTTFDLDGAGPQPSLFIAGGDLSTPGVPSQSMMGFDGQRWVGVEGALPTGAIVRAFTVYNNQLVVGGAFSFMNASAASNVALWNGTAWIPLGAGLNNTVQALAVYNGELYAGGVFTASGSTPALSIAKWNGSTWTSVAGGVTSSGVKSVNALLSFNGLLFVGGQFSQAGGIAATNLATWNGSTWAAFGNPDNIVYSLASYSGIALNSNRVFVAGAFNNVGGIAASKTAILRFDPINGNVWSTMGSPANTRECRSLHVVSLGVSTFQVNAIHVSTANASSVQRWTGTGTTWTSLLSGASAQCLGFRSGQLVAGLSGTNTLFSDTVLSYNGTSWNKLAQVANAWPMTSIAWTGSEVVGAMQDGPSGLANTVRRRNPTTGVWTDLAPSVRSTGSLKALLPLASGELIAGGSFSNFGGGSNCIARWTGTNWVSIAGGFSNAIGSPSINALALLPDGDIVAAGSFTFASGQGASNIARWRSPTWVPMSGISGTVFALKVASDGTLYAGGFFQNASNTVVNNICRWDGVIWRPLATGLAGIVYSIEEMSDGSIVATGQNTTPLGQPFATNVVRWNGTSWTSLGGAFTGTANSLQALPNGELITSGSFTSVGGVAVNAIARWDGTTWVAMESGLQSGPDVSFASAMQLIPGGTLAVAGAFHTAGSSLSANFAIWKLPVAGCCDPIDFNQDSLFPDDADLVDLLSVLAGGACSTSSCGDIDFNNDGLFPDDADLLAFLRVLAGGTCEP